MSAQGKLLWPFSSVQSVPSDHIHRFVVERDLSVYGVLSSIRSPCVCVLAVCSKSFTCVCVLLYACVCVCVPGLHFIISSGVRVSYVSNPISECVCCVCV